MTAVAQRVAEHMMRARRFGPKVILRVDLHGVSCYGPGEAHTAIRWEWIEAISVATGGVQVRSASDTITLPSGAFGFEPGALGKRLEEARSITRRPEIIGELASHQ